VLKMTLNNNHVRNLSKYNNKSNKTEKKSTWIDRFATYEAFAFIGVIMIAGVLIKLLGYADFSSDWFWLLAGIGLVIEGSISLVKQKRFDRKYKIIERED
jgi:hypothetical protein